MSGIRKTDLAAQKLRQQFFHFVKANPGLTRDEICEKMNAQGIKIAKCQIWTARKYWGDRIKIYNTGFGKDFKQHYKVEESIKPQPIAKARIVHVEKIMAEKYGNKSPDKPKGHRVYIGSCMNFTNLG